MWLEGRIHSFAFAESSHAQSAWQTCSLVVEANRKLEPAWMASLTCAGATIDGRKILAVTSDRVDVGRRACLRVAKWGPFEWLNRVRLAPSGYRRPCVLYAAA